jgi:hypothetical protein
VDGQPFTATTLYAFASSTDGRGWVNVTALDGCGAGNTSITLLADRLEGGPITPWTYSSTRSLSPQVGPGAFTTVRN